MSFFWWYPLLMVSQGIPGNIPTMVQSCGITQPPAAPFTLQINPQLCHPVSPSPPCQCCLVL